MKKNYIPALFFFFSITTFVRAQLSTFHTNSPIYSRLHVTSDGEYLENIRWGNPYLPEHWNFYFYHSLYFTNLLTETAGAAYPVFHINEVKKVRIWVFEYTPKSGRNYLVFPFFFEPKQHTYFTASNYERKNYTTYTFDGGMLPSFSGSKLPDECQPHQYYRLQRIFHGQRGWNQPLRPEPEFHNDDMP